MEPRHAVLFEPLAIGPKTLPNRFYQVPHASGFGSAMPRSQAAFRAVKAEGGWGAVCTDYAPVSMDAEETPAVASDCWDPEDMRRLGIVADAVHAHGALAGIELYHGGGESQNGFSRSPRIAPTQRMSPWRHMSAAREMTIDDIQRVQRDFELAANRARDVGFDIVYVYGAHGYLLSQWLSSTTNQRTDGYGGSLVNRARFVLETLERVRSAIGDECAIALRMAIDGREELPGIHVDEMLEVVRLAEPLVDLFDVNVGSWPEDSGTSRYYPEGHERPWTSRVREATSKPILGVGRYTSPDLMAAIVSSGELDIIGAARPAIADPFLPQKVREGRLDEIRECTGSNVCILREETFRHVGCLQNPTAGEEHRRGWHPERIEPAPEPDVPILVIGAGPAGMECAVTLARRGYRAVHLVDAEPELGGSMRWTRRLPTLGDWGRVIDHRTIALAKLAGVEVILGRRLTREDVLAYGATTVIVATGSTWCDDGSQPDRLELIEGSDRALTPERVMAGARPQGSRVLVYDADGYYVGPGIAELLRVEGRDVTLVTPHPVVSPVSDESLEGHMLRSHLHEMGIVMVTGVTLVHIGEGAARGADEYGREWSTAADGVVLVTQRRSDDHLYRSLSDDPEALAAAGIDRLLLIGDALAPRMPSEAVFDGHRLARELESDDPMVPRPYLLERPSP